MAKSTLVAIMGRMATYTGQLITWDEAFNSEEDLTPPQLSEPVTRLALQMCQNPSMPMIQPEEPGLLAFRFLLSFARS